MNDKAKIRHRVISVEAGVVDINWENAHDCTVETGSLTGTVISKARQLENVVGISGLLENYEVRYRFVENTALIEVCTFNYCDDLLGFENKLDTAREQLHIFMIKRPDRNETSNTAKLNSPPEFIKDKAKAEDALEKFFSGPSIKKMQIDFLGAGKEVVELKKTASVTTRVLDENAVMEVAGEVRQFDDEHQKLTLYKVQGIRNQIVLTVQNAEHRKLLLSAQSERRIVSVHFIPERDTRRPDDVPTAGELHDVKIIGWAQDEML